MAKRYAVTVWHGESASVFYVVDTWAPEGEGPDVVASYRNRQEAESHAEWLEEGPRAEERDAAIARAEFAMKVHRAWARIGKEG